MNGVCYTFLCVTEPGSHRGPARCYVHLSTAPHLPSIIMNRPNESNPSALRRVIGTDLSDKTVNAYAMHWKSRNIRSSIGGMQYGPLWDNPEDASHQRRREICRMLECTSVEEAVKSWDSEAIKQYVELMDLEVVPIRSEDPFKPHMHVSQKIIGY